MQVRSLLRAVDTKKLTRLTLDDNMVGKEAVNLLITRILAPESAIEELRLKNTMLQNSIELLPAIVIPSRL